MGTGRLNDYIFFILFIRVSGDRIDGDQILLACFHLFYTWELSYLLKYVLHYKSKYTVLIMAS